MCSLFRPALTFVLADLNEDSLKTCHLTRVGVLLQDLIRVRFNKLRDSLTLALNALFSYNLHIWPHIYTHRKWYPALEVHLRSYRNFLLENPKKVRWNSIEG